MFPPIHIYFLWSVEVNHEEVIIQRSKEVEAVRDYLRTERRNPVDEVPIKEDSSESSLKTFVDVLRDPGAPMNKQRHPLFNSCKNFAQFVFNRLAKTSRWSEIAKELDDFKRRLPEWIGNLDVKISKVRIYTSILSGWPGTLIFFYHAFVVLETNGGWWWSVEMNEEQVIIQRSKEVEAVRDCLRTERRNLVTNVPFKEDASENSLKTIVDVLRAPGAPLNKEYSRALNNCQHFAQFVFNRLAKTSRW